MSDQSPDPWRRRIGGEPCPACGDPGRYHLPGTFPCAKRLLEQRDGAQRKLATATELLERMKSSEFVKFVGEPCVEDVLEALRDDAPEEIERLRGSRGKTGGAEDE